MATNYTPPKTFERGPIVKLPRYTKWATVPGQAKRAQLVWSIQDGNPRLTVFYNNPEIQRPVSVGWGLDTALTVFELMLKVIRGPAGAPPCVIENFNNNRDQDGVVDGKQKTSEVYFQKNNDGVFWIGIKDIASPKPSVAFTFTGSDFHKFIVKDGDASHPMPLSELSQLYASGYIKGLLDTYLRMNVPANLGVTANSLIDEETPTPQVSVFNQHSHQKPGQEFDDLPQ